LSKLQIKAVEILTRVIGVELEQTKKLVYDTKVSPTFCYLSIAILLDYSWMTALLE